MPRSRSNGIRPETISYFKKTFGISYLPKKNSELMFLLQGYIQKRNELILREEKRVRIIVKQMASRLPSHISFSELIQVGFEGLIDAADRFNESYGVQFGTYADIRIQGKIKDFLREKTVTGVGRSGKSKVKKARESGNAGEVHFDNDIALLFQALRPALTFEELLYEGKEVQDALNGNPETALEKKQKREFIEKHVLPKLPPRSQKVIELYFFQHLTQKQIGKIIGLGEPRINQIINGSLEFLKERFNNTPNPFL